jgi:anti-sigma regulatory factor (Ser/Thr protein kinase)
VAEEEVRGCRDGMRRLQLCHRAEPTELRAIRRRVERWAEQNALSTDAVIDLQLALGEAVSNGVEHAYGAARDGGTVDVELQIRPPDRGPVTAVAVRVSDHGRWRPAPVLPSYRGRGLALIQQLAEDLQVSSTRHGTEVCFEIPVFR